MGGGGMGGAMPMGIIGGALGKGGGGGPELPGGGGGTLPDEEGFGGAGRTDGGTRGGGMMGTGFGSIRNANWKKNCFVSLFQCVHRRLGSLSTSRLGTYTPHTMISE